MTAPFSTWKDWEYNTKAYDPEEKNKEFTGTTQLEQMTVFGNPSGIKLGLSLSVLPKFVLPLYVRFLYNAIISCQHQIASETQQCQILIRADLYKHITNSLGNVQGNTSEGIDIEVINDRVLAWGTRLLGKPVRIKLVQFLSEVSHNGITNIQQHLRDNIVTVAIWPTGVLNGNPVNRPLPAQADSAYAMFSGFIARARTTPASLVKTGCVPENDSGCSIFKPKGKNPYTVLMWRCLVASLPTTGNKLNEAMVLLQSYDQQLYETEFEYGPQLDYDFDTFSNTGDSTIGGGSRSVPSVVDTTYVFTAEKWDDYDKMHTRYGTRNLIDMMETMDLFDKDDSNNPTHVTDFCHANNPACVEVNHIFYLMANSYIGHNPDFEDYERSNLIAITGSEEEKMLIRTYDLASDGPLDLDDAMHKRRQAMDDGNDPDLSYDNRANFQSLAKTVPPYSAAPGPWNRAVVVNDGGGAAAFSPFAADGGGGSLPVVMRSASADAVAVNPFAADGGGRSLPAVNMRSASADAAASFSPSYDLEHVISSSPNTWYSNRDLARVGAVTNARRYANPIRVDDQRDDKRGVIGSLSGNPNPKSPKRAIGAAAAASPE